MSCNIDYLAVIRDGLEEFTGDQFNQLVHDVVGWLADRKLLDETELPIAKGFFDDVLNIMVSTSGKSDVRKKILRKAQATKNPSEAVLWEMRKLLEGDRQESLFRPSGKDLPAGCGSCAGPGAGRYSPVDHANEAD